MEPGSVDNLSVVYQSRDFLVVNKHWDLRIDSKTWRETLTLQKQLRHRFPELADPDTCYGFRSRGADTCSDRGRGRGGRGHLLGQGSGARGGADTCSDRGPQSAATSNRIPPSLPPCRFCHQLDFSTSGALCVALNKAAAGSAYRCFKERRVTKAYLALVSPRGGAWRSPRGPLAAD